MDRLDLAIDALLSGGAQEEPLDLALAGLVEVAGSLRDLPDDGFKTRFGLELQRRTPMTTSITTATATIHAVTPFITVADGNQLIEFMKKTFDAEEVSRAPHGSGDGFVAVVRIVDSDLLIMGGESTRGQERPTNLHVFVKDCDATYGRALEAGAVTAPPGVGEPADRPYGERSAFVIDPFGNQWYIGTRRGANYVPAGLGHVTAYMHPAKSADLIDFLKEAFGAEQVARFEHDGAVMHAVVKIGGGVVEMGDANRDPVAFYLYTDDVDAVYHRAVSAGATSLVLPADQAYGDRMAAVRDPFGNVWFAAKPIAR
jgi:PhnB protein